MLTDHNSIEVEITNRKITRSLPSIWKLENVLVVHALKKKKSLKGKKNKGKRMEI